MTWRDIPIDEIDAWLEGISLEPKPEKERPDNWWWPYQLIADDRAVRVRPPSDPQPVLEAPAVDGEHLDRYVNMVAASLTLTGLATDRPITKTRAFQYTLFRKIAKHLAKAAPDMKNEIARVCYTLAISRPGVEQ